MQFFILIFTFYRFDYEPIETHNDNFEASNYSIEVGKEETSSFPNDSVFNSSTISTIRQPVDESSVTNNGIENQIDDIYTTLQEINSQLKFLTKKQKKIDNQITASLPINTAALCENLEPVLTSK